MDERYLEILRHSLGLRPDGGGVDYRNYFVAGGDDEACCRALVALGLMVEGRRSDMTGGDPLFHVTDAGKVKAEQ